MNKKIMCLLLLIVLIAMSALSLSACSVPLSDDEIESAYNTAVENTMKADLYYWQEYVYKDIYSTMTNVNVLASMDNKYELIKDPDGKYSELSIQVYEELNGVRMKEYLAGRSKGVGKNDPIKEYKFTSVRADEVYLRSKKPSTAYEYFYSEEFKQYTLNERLKELKTLKFEDMDFDYKGSEGYKKNHLSKLTFKVKESYLREFERDNGSKSIFEGADSVTIEMAYDRISQLVIYDKESLDKFAISKERYNFRVVYYGAKIAIPKYNEMNDKNELVWKDEE